jgi:ABC-type multidrug transport system fused ATPase/permease subunit
VSFWNYFWLIVWSFLFIAYLFVLIQIFIDVFRDSKLSGGFKALWVIVLIIFPLIAGLVYIIARGRGMAERQQEAAQQSKKAADTYIQQVASTSPADQIASAKKLLDDGTITQAEYDQLKSRALAA